MPRLPPVAMSRQTRLRARFCPGLIGSMATFLQSHSSSSATSCARPVCVPCPISARAMRITQVSSGLTTSQALISALTAWAAASPAPSGMLSPRANPPLAAADPTTNLRREMFVLLPEWVLFMLTSLEPVIMRVNSPHVNDGSASLARSRRHVDGRADALIGAAPAYIGHRLVYILVGRLRVFRE